MMWQEIIPREGMKLDLDKKWDWETTSKQASGRLRTAALEFVQED